LTDQCLKYVLSIENNLPVDTQQLLDPQRLAEIVDEHVSYVGLASTRASYIGQQTAFGQGRYQSHWKNKFGGIESGGANSHKFDGHKPQHQGQGQGKNHFGRRCTICQSTSHYKSECDKLKERGKWPPKHVSSAIVISHVHGNTAAVNKPQRTQPDKSAAQAAPGDQQVSVYKVALDSVVDRDSSVGLVASGASGIIGIERKSVDRVCREESVAERMNECVGLQSSDIMNDDVDDESFDIVTMFNDCLPPVNEDIRCDNVQQVANIDLRFDMEKFIAHSDASMHFVDLCISDESGNSVLLKTLFDSVTQLSILKEDLI